MKNLIKMSEYVLEQKHSWFIDRYNKIQSYAKFITQPLEKWMFVACDEDGNVLSLDELVDSEGYVLDEIEFKEYEQAKAKVLFEGIEEYLSQINYWIEVYDTIEDLIPYNLELTDNNF